MKYILTRKSAISIPHLSKWKLTGTVHQFQCIPWIGYYCFNKARINGQVLYHHLTEEEMQKLRMAHFPPSLS